MTRMNVHDRNRNHRRVIGSQGDKEVLDTQDKLSIEDQEGYARSLQIRNPLILTFLGFYAACKVMVLYLINIETVITCGLSVGLTIYWYNYGVNQIEQIGNEWNGGSMDYVILAFAVTSPIAAAIGMAFNRRERALTEMADFQSFAHQLYMAHSLWDWDHDDENKNGSATVNGDDGCTETTTFDFHQDRSKLRLKHSDAVMTQLIGIGDEMARLLTLPTVSRSIHRMTKPGKQQAAETTDVAYRLLYSMTSHRLTRLSVYGERIKKAGLSAGEVSRIRQYERWLEDNVKRLRMIKVYRTPQAFRSFARLFTIFLPPFYAPTYAQVAIDTHSLAVGILFGIVTALALTALFESLQVLEDPFVATLQLDGIDCREEFQVLLWNSLINTRRTIFPSAPDFPQGRRKALDFETITVLPFTDNATDSQPTSPSSPLQNHATQPSTAGSFVVTVQNNPPPPGSATSFHPRVFDVREASQPHSLHSTYNRRNQIDTARSEEDNEITALPTSNHTTVVTRTDSLEFGDLLDDVLLDSQHSVGNTNSVHAQSPSVTSPADADVEGGKRSNVDDTAAKTNNPTTRTENNGGDGDRPSVVMTQDNGAASPARHRRRKTNDSVVSMTSTATGTRNNGKDHNKGIRESDFERDRKKYSRHRGHHPQHHPTHSRQPSSTSTLWGGG